MQTPSALRLVAAAAVASLAALTADAQLVGSNTAETHPPLTTQTCTSSGCTDEDTSIVLDANWRWLYKEGTSTNCYTGNSWDKTICSDPKTCASSCALDGADYTGTYGITAESNSLSLKLVTKGPYSTNIGSRVYVMESDDTYKAYKLLNQEFTFDVDVSGLDCGLNGALYFVDMETDGGMKRFPSNKAGAKYGTGYCDAQCPQDLKFISGEANVLNWTPNKIDSNAGTGKYGACCAEMDIWESNSISNAYTTHPCTISSKAGGAYRCSSATECGVGKNRYKGVCDKDGCDFNPYRMGNKTFFGPGSDFTIDTTKKVTVVTRFITDDNTATGTLSEITRFYVQDGVTHEMPHSTFSAIKGMKSLKDNQCSAAKTLFGDEDDHKAKGGLEQIGLAMKRGMVLTMSLWTDNVAQCLWLDSDYPVTADASKPGVSRGTCAKTSGVPKEVIAEQAEATVQFSNIRFGDIGTTVKGISTKMTKTTTTTKKTTTPKKTTAPSAATTETANEADPEEVGADADTEAASVDTEAASVDTEAASADTETESAPATTTSSCKRRK
ncbi:putative glycosyl hydrolase family 7 protein [Phytophthora sojae]|uniref:cellulose 1,4-beta-cellobiosidase (non-reducing end) n=1 Tax=Phytophthora sojae (strain P6497) TaxID=1094619 RepID=G4YUK6_PHYSP|nr:putative glycosyl hydrolase family 7 protein [Phytophthora sojae]EGZ25461.1 putative glycosyl hydrolase family 7 protein [Phytophthora sojae]|eukprot:XP_009520749.1 putative glycosyl hydrolase family 7 protein [Phytophthora sojae]